MQWRDIPMLRRCSLALRSFREGCFPVAQRWLGSKGFHDASRWLYVQRLPASFVQPDQGRGVASLTVRSARVKTSYTGPGRENGRFRRNEVQQVSVARDKHVGVGRARQSHQIVVVRVGGEAGLGRRVR